jgi:hypothetical protein
MTELIDKGHFIELARLNPREVCRRASCTFDERRNCYTLPVWGVEHVIYPDAGKIACGLDSRPLHEYFTLVAIHYLLSAREISPVREWISEKDIPGGVTFFRGPHAIPTHLITSRVNNSIETFKELGCAYHGSPLNMADAAFTFNITDRIPVAVLYWKGDEDFPAEAKILYDKTLPSHFALDIVFALASGICAQLSR